MAACTRNRKNRKIVLLFAVALGMGLVFPAAAVAQERVGDVEFSVYPLPAVDMRSGGGTRHGYVEHRVRLRNTGRQDRVVHLSHPKLDRDVNHGVVVTRSVRIAGGQEVVVSLYQPPVSVAEETLEIRVEGVARSKEIRVAGLYGYNYGSSSNVQSAILLSRGVPRDFPSTPESEENAKPVEIVVEDEEEEEDEFDIEVDSGMGMGMGAMHPSERFALFRSELPVAQWSPNWLGYSCYDAILCSAKEAEEMPPQVRLAVRRFVECGGMLFIHGQSVPAAFSEHGVSDGKGGYYVGMGHVVPTSEPGKDDWDATYQKLLDTSIHVYQPEDRPGNQYDLLVAGATVPVRGLFLLVLVFGVVIGPANLWLLSRYKRRIWLWWNVPAISAVTCLLVFGYSLASEGWTGYGKTASLTLLDESTRRATTIGYMSYYNPLAPGGLHFDSETDVALLDTAVDSWRRYRGREATGLRFVDWTNDQHMTSGWMKARVPAYLQIRKNADRRERLTVEPRADGSLKVVNALGAHIKRLDLADASGRVFEGRNIPAGAERTLTRSSSTLPDEENPGRMRGLFTDANWLGRFHMIERAPDPAALLAPGCYLAHLDHSPFVESPLSGVDSEHSTAIVYGIMRGQEDGR